MKYSVGIITCFDLDNVNYGNRLQSYALNRYLTEEFPDYEIETLIVPPYVGFKFTTNENVVLKTAKLLKYNHKKYKVNRKVLNRKKKINEFSYQYIRIRNEKMSMRKLQKGTYDAFIVGSDVVWMQLQNGVRKPRYLDFEESKKFIKIAYAASFGRNYIPDCNLPYIRDCLGKFDYISVREESSLELLNSIGIPASYVVDPVNLLENTEWKKIALKPNSIGTQKFIFSYFIGKQENARILVKKIAKEIGATIVTVPFASGLLNKADNYADIDLLDCSVEEWLWLIENAEIVVSDSYHAIVFSVLMNTRFFAVKREEVHDINIRIIDFLTYIDQLDKYIDADSYTDLKLYEWNFNTINNLIANLTFFSKEFLHKSLENVSAELF